MSGTYEQHEYWYLVGITKKQYDENGTIGWRVARLETEKTSVSRWTIDPPVLAEDEVGKMGKVLHTMEFPNQFDIPTHLRHTYAIHLQSSMCVESKSTDVICRCQMHRIRIHTRPKCIYVTDCVLFTIHLTNRAHPAHPVSALIPHPRGIYCQALWS